MKNFFSGLFHSLLESFRPSPRIQTEQPIAPEHFQKMLAQTLVDPGFRRLLINSLMGPIIPIEGGICNPGDGTVTKSSNTQNHLTKWSATSCDLADSAVYESGGNVGIGTSTPAHPLHVTAANSDTARIEGTISSGYSQLWFQGTGRRYQVGVGNAAETSFSVANKFYVYDGGAGQMRLTVDTSGNVDIGTTSPAARLDVAGIFLFDSTTGQEKIIPTHAVGSGSSWAAVTITPTLTGSGTDAIVGTYTRMQAPTGHKTFMYGYDIDLFPGGEQTPADNDLYDVNGINIENQGLYRAESAVSVGGGASITNGGDNASLFGWVQAIELSTSAEVGIWFGESVISGHAPFGIGIDMFLSSFNTCAIRLPNGTGNGIRGRNAANSGDYRLIDIDSSNNVVIGAATAVVQGAPSSAPADASLNDSNISFWVDETNDQLMVKVKYSGGGVKNGIICSLT